MRFFGKSKEEKMAEAQAKQALKNGKNLKQVLTALKEIETKLKKVLARDLILMTQQNYSCKRFSMFGFQKVEILMMKNSGKQLIIINSLIIQLNITKDKKKKESLWFYHC